MLLLPGATTPYARAAEAVRAGFFAAHAAPGADGDRRPRDRRDAGVGGAEIEAAAGRGVRMVVGPLSRDAVDALDAAAARGCPCWR